MLLNLKRLEILPQHFRYFLMFIQVNIRGTKHFLISLSKKTVCLTVKYNVRSELLTRTFAYVSLIISTEFPVRRLGGKSGHVDFSLQK